MNVGDMQRKLSLWATQDNERTFYGLYALLSDADWLQLAHDAGKQNAGSMTAGCAGITMQAVDEHLEAHLQQLGQDLNASTFAPAPVRRGYIRKANGKLRPLGIATIRDRIGQERRNREGEYLDVVSSVSYSKNAAESTGGQPDARITCLSGSEEGVRKRTGEPVTRLAPILRNVFRALQVIDDLAMDLEDIELTMESVKKLRKAVGEFRGYIAANQSFIPNYGDRYRHGEAISTAFVESTVNQVVSRRMVKQQQMRWMQRGAHLLPQGRTHVLNEDLREIFGRWYPGMQTGRNQQQKAA